MIIFHHDDLDGICSAAILYWALPVQEKIKTIEVNYDNPIPLGEVSKDEVVYIVDFSFKPEIMEKLFEITENVIWIDHHKSALDYKYSKELAGLRDARDKMFSGCELVWKFLYGDGVAMPDAVKYIGDFDKWKWAYGEESRKYKEGMLSLDWKDPTAVLWKEVLFDDTLTKEIQQRGSVCLVFKESFLKDYKEKFSFECELEGKKCLACGFYAFGSELFGDSVKDYDMVVNFEFDGKKWSYGLYSDGRTDVSKICQKYGGGGHKGAGGFTSKEFLLK